MSTLKLGPVSCLYRSKTLFHAAAQSMGCPPTPCSMAKCWRMIRPWTDSFSLWKRLRCGTELNKNNQAALFEHFPTLRTLYDNPLWMAISHPEWVNEWDELAASIRIGGKPLDAYNGKLTRLLYGRVDWPCLGVHLVLLQTQGTRFMFHRMWLEKNLLAMAGLSCIQRPIRNIRNEFQDFLFRIFVGTEPASHDGWQYWRSCWAFDEKLFEFLQERQWLHGDDQQLALLIWNFRQQLLRELDVGPQKPMGEIGCGLPHSLRKKWCRERSQWMDHPIHLNGVCCEFSHQHASTAVSRDNQATSLTT